MQSIRVLVQIHQISRAATINHWRSSVRSPATCMTGGDLHDPDAGLLFSLSYITSSSQRPLRHQHIAHTRGLLTLPGISSTTIISEKDHQTVSVIRLGLRDLSIEGSYQTCGAKPNNYHERVYSARHLIAPLAPFSQVVPNRALVRPWLLFMES